MLFFSLIGGNIMKEQLEQERLRLIVFKSALELGQKVDEHLLNMYNYDKEKLRANVLFRLG